MSELQSQLSAAKNDALQAAAAAAAAREEAGLRQQQLAAAAEAAEGRLRDVREQLESETGSLRRRLAEEEDRLRAGRVAWEQERADMEAAAARRAAAAQASGARPRGGGGRGVWALESGSEGLDELGMGPCSKRAARACMG